VVWSGRWLVVARRGSRFLLIEMSTGKRFAWDVDAALGAGSRSFEPFLGGGSKEIWLLDRSRRSVERFSLPGD
jgi:hypothetical protein